jgi:hypothetical protein
MKGRYKPKNPRKYRGDPTNIIYRSQYELTYMRWCDSDPSVIEWSSEEIKIPYRSILDEAYEKKNRLPYKRWHRYFVDFYVKVRSRDGTEKRYLVEVKPKHETKPPVTKGTNKSSKTILRQKMTWAVNSAKWEAARAWCSRRGMEFKIITEKELYGR